jgi:hypothetical protein
MRVDIPAVAGRVSRSFAHRHVQVIAEAPLVG